MLHSFFVKIEGKYQSIAFDDIDYIEACKNYVRIVTVEQKFFPHTTMKQMEEKLPQNLFCRIHKSYIIALNKITAFDHEHVYLKSIRLSLGANYFEGLKNKLIVICPEQKQVKEIDSQKSFKIQN
jgi:DNA-binding LytR/AlgR family response regulator